MKEALELTSLPKEMYPPRMTLVGTHLICRWRKKNPGILRIHITRNLHSIQGNNTLSYSRNLIKSVRADLQELGELLIIDRFKNIHFIEGVAAFPPQLAARFGFDSTPTVSFKFIRLLAHIIVNRKRLGDAKPNLDTLHTFYITREKLIELYAKTNKSKL